MPAPRQAGAGPRIVVALDYAAAAQAWAVVASLDPTLCRLKVGKELFTRAGPDFIHQLVAQGYDVFLDLKFHDIPHTVAQACVAAADLGVWMINVHASGGSKMMQAAAEAVARRTARPLLTAVTVLTSMNDDDLREIGVTVNTEEQVLRLTHLAHTAGLDGVVCSAQEARLLRQHVPEDFCLVTPGIRPRGSARGDQQRIMTPSEAMTAGADYLVIGRPITQAADPRQALLDIQAELEHSKA